MLTKHAGFGTILQCSLSRCCVHMQPHALSVSHKTPTLRLTLYAYCSGRWRGSPPTLSGNLNREKTPKHGKKIVLEPQGHHMELRAKFFVALRLKNKEFQPKEPIEFWAQQLSFRLTENGKSRIKLSIDREFYIACRTLLSSFPLFPLFSAQSRYSDVLRELVYWGNIGGRWTFWLDDLGGLSQHWWFCDSLTEAKLPLFIQLHASICRGLATEVGWKATQIIHLRDVLM